MNKKHFLSSLAVAAFFIFAIASKVNKIHQGAFNTNVSPEISKNDSYLVLADGSHVFGSKISYKSGLLFKDQIKVDDKAFKINETLGYYSNGYYYGRLGGQYIKRIVHGKINVYIHEYWVTTTSSATGIIRQEWRARHFYQVGEEGEMLPLAGQKDIKRAVAGCPLAVEMADKSNGKMRRAIKKDYNYLNSIFEIYNNGCK